MGLILYGEGAVLHKSFFFLNSVIVKKAVYMGLCLTSQGLLFAAASETVFKVILRIVCYSLCFSTLFSQNEILAQCKHILHFGSVLL